MLSRYSVKRPFTVLVGVLLVIVLGIVSLTRMTTDLLPNMSFQYALIITTDIGASPEKVETEVTAPIESAMATTTSIKNITSSSNNSYSLVTLEYEQNANMDSVVIEIQQKLDQISGSWGDSVGTPMIMKINPDMLPIMMATVDQEGMDSAELSDYVLNELVPSLESVEGVAQVNTTGQLEEKVEVTLNQEKIDALNEKIKAAIEAQFVDPQNQLNQAKDQIENGQDAIASGGDTLTSTINGALEGREQLYKTEEDLDVQRADLVSKKTSLNTLLAGLTQANEMATKVDASDDALPMGLSAKELENAIARLNTVLSYVSPGSPEESALQTQIAAAQSGLNTYNSTLATNFAGLSAMGITITTYHDLAPAIATVSTMITQIDAGIAQIDAAKTMIAEQKVNLGDALNVLNANAALAAIQMSTSSAQLSTAAASLETAQGNLDDAKNQALSGADLNNVLTLETLKGLLVAQNFDMPAGYVMDGDTQYLVRVGEAVTTIDDLTNLILLDFGLDGVDPIHLTDIADVEITDNSSENYAIVNGKPGISLTFEKQTGYATGEVTDRLLDKFEKLEKENKNLSISVLMNQGVYIDMIVKSVFQNMIFGAILAIFVLLLFLKSVKPTVIIACSIPLSVLVAVVLMYFTGITMNVISMSGLVLGIGMLVDNSIVVIENIYRLRGMGYSIKKAAVEGASQVAGAIIASTLTTISVYAPIIFTDGITRQLFVDLALTIAFTLVASLVVALTFVPALSSALMNKSKETKHPWLDAVLEVYGRFLNQCLRFKPIVFVVAIVLLIGSAGLAISRGMTFMDMDMETNQLSVTLQAKEGEKLTFEELTALSDEAVSRIMEIDGIDTIGATAGGNSTMGMLGGSQGESVSMYILLDENSGVTTAEVTKQIEEKTKDMDCEINTDSSSMDFSAYFGQGLSIQIKGNDLDTLQSLAKDVAAILEKTEGTTDVDDGLDKATPQWTITVDKDKAAEYGMTVAQVFQVVYEKMASASSATTIQTDIKNYQVYLQTEEQAEVTLDDIKNLTFKSDKKPASNAADADENSGKDGEVKLTEICTMEETTTLSTIRRDAQSRYLTVGCAVDLDHNVTLVSNKVQKEIKKLDVPEGYSIKMQGEDETINESMSQMMLMLLLAVVFIYLIMVAQFQSLVAPFIIMFTIPLAFTGGFIALFITGNEVSIIAMLGFIMLAGLIVNNGIVLIDYINQERRRGVSKHEAIIDAGKTRFRPILMTALTTILAMSTSAIGIGEGSDMMKPMAITIIGGLIYGTLLTAIVIPCIYDAFHREKDMTEEEL